MAVPRNPSMAHRPHEKMGRIHVVGQEYRVSGYISRNFIRSNSDRLRLTDDLSDALVIKYIPSSHPHALALPREGTPSAPAWLGIKWWETNVVANLGSLNRHASALAIITGNRAKHSISIQGYNGPLWWAAWSVSEKGDIDVVGVKNDGRTHTLRPVCDTRDTEIQVVNSAIEWLKHNTDWRLVRFEFEPL